VTSSASIRRWRASSSVRHLAATTSAAEIVKIAPNTHISAAAVR
jgi:hypothetical protein